MNYIEISMLTELINFLNEKNKRSIKININ